LRLIHDPNSINNPRHTGHAANAFHGDLTEVVCRQNSLNNHVVVLETDFECAEMRVALLMKGCQHVLT